MPNNKKQELHVFFTTDIFLLELYSGYYFNRMIFFCLIALYQLQISYRIDREMRIHVNIVKNDFEGIVFACEAIILAFV